MARKKRKSNRRARTKQPKGDAEFHQQYVHEGIFGYPKSLKERHAFLRKKKAGEAAFVEGEHVDFHTLLVEGKLDQHLRFLADVLPQIVCTAEPDGYQDYFNRRWFTYTGMTEEETYGGKTSLHPDDFDNYVRLWGEAVRKGTVYEAEYRLRRHDGAYRWHLARALPIKDNDGKVLKWFSTHTDIHDMKVSEQALRKREDELQKLNRTLRALDHSSHAMTRARDEARYLEEVCRIVVEDCGYALMWIGFAEDGPGQPVRPAAYAGFEKGYLEKLRVTWRDTPRGRGPTGTAIRTGKPAFCRHMPTDPAFRPWRREALKRGYASSVALPLLADGKAFGAVTIYAREPDPFSEDEVQLLTQLAGDLAHGITAIRLRIAHAQAEEEVARLATFPEKNPNPILEVDLAGHILYINPMASRLFPDLPKRGRLHPWIAGLDGYASRFRKGEVPLYVREIVVGDRWFQQTLHYLAQDKRIRTYGIDISERKKAEEEARRLNEELEQRVQERTAQLEEARARDRTNLLRLEDIIHHMQTGIVASDEKGRVIHVNNQYCRMFRFDGPQALLGKTATQVREELKKQLLSPDDLKVIVDTGARRVPVFGSEIRLKDGRIFSRDYIPILEGNVFHGHIAVYRDITREKRIDAAKSDFMSFASHQLRTPLTAVRWALGRIRKGMEPGSEQFRLAEAAHRASRSMAETINTMLSISRIEAGTVSLSAADICLRDSLRDVEATLQDEIKYRGQVVDVRCPDDLRLVTDVKFLSEALLNLLSNAVKYSPDRSTVTVTAQREGESVRLDVEDRGFGIPAHEQDRVFQKFFRGENAVQALAEGSGLGLYLVSLLVQKLQGSISFVSQEGKGTTFTVHLPASIAQGA